MKLTKIIALLLAFALVGAQLAACGTNGDYTDEEGVPEYSKGLDENGFLRGIKASDYVTLPEYKGLDIDKSLMEVSDEDVQKEIDQILSRYETYVEITDENAAIKDGDTVNIDYVGYVDEVQFDGGNTGKLGVDVTIGVTQYIDDFLEQLIGHHPGESFDIYVTFPEDYGKEDLNGKEARFAITINHIHGEKIEAEMSDEIAKDYGFNTADALIEDIKSFLLGNDRFYFFVEILEKAECENVPQAAIDYIKNLDLLNAEYTASNYGYTLENYLLAMNGYETMDEYFAARADSYKKDAILYLAAQAMAEIEGITITSQEVVDEGYSSYLETYGEPYMKQFMLFQHRLPTFVAENGNVVEK